MGTFGKRLFERSEFPIAAHENEQNRNQAVGGSLFFGFFLLAKQKKETRQSRESDYWLRHYLLLFKTSQQVLNQMNLNGFY